MSAVIAQRDDLLRIAKEATNGWACYAKRKIEHDEIARLHEAIAKASAAPPTGGPAQFPIPLNAEQERAAKEWAADDRLWTTQETVEFNLRTFARKILAAGGPAPASGGEDWQPIATAPKDDGQDLILFADGLVGHGFFDRANQVWRWVDDHEIGEATHWMPLPSAPGAAPTEDKEK
jgi:hypothetical protein